jgi:hypothetical protein
MNKYKQLLMSVACAGMVIASPPPCHGQSLLPDHGTKTGVGYVVNAPLVLSGVHVAVIRPHGWGGFADVIANLATPEGDPDFLAGITAHQASQEYGDFRIQHVSSWTSGNIGIVRVITDQFAVYGGAGFSVRTVFAEFNDSSGTRGNMGKYWVRDEDGADRGIGLVGGTYLLATPRVLFQFGGSSRPAAVRLGASLLFGG